jgi:predicted nucleotidyltransferase
VAERAELIERAASLLKANSDVAAAWLHGSMGRGTFDEWSDVDLWIVVSDHQLDEIRTERRAFAESLGEVLLTVEAPQNAPAGGAYLLAMYHGTCGPHILDCSWQPLSVARRPADTVVLFDRAGIRLVETVEAGPVDAQIAHAASQVSYFWMMVTVVAKYIARRDTWGVLNLLSALWSTIKEIEQIAGMSKTTPTYRDRPAFEPPVSPAAQLAALRSLVAELNRLMQQVPALSAQIGPDVSRQVGLYVSLVEAQCL